MTMDLCWQGYYSGRLNGGEFEMKKFEESFPCVNEKYSLRQFHPKTIKPWRNTMQNIAYLWNMIW